MANVIAIKQPTRTIDLGDGVERDVRVTLNAMAELEIKYGSIEEAFNKIQSGSIAAIRYLLWLILVPDGDEDLTEKQIGNLIDLNKLNDLMSVIMDVMEEAMPEAMPDQVGDSPKANGPNRQTLVNDWT